MEKKLQVKNLTVSFRTTDGKVQAVRGINFDLNKGETLAIVGESGSGKSVTSKAILGILAGNSIIEGGEIIYDGKDLLKISEEEFHAIRGDKIAMIFQDPMSSLNPIVKIGRQLTEAMILKGKARQRESRKNFNNYIAMLEKRTIEANEPKSAERAAGISKKCKDFDTFERTHLKLENAYNVAYEAASDASSDLEELIFEISKNSVKDMNERVKRALGLAAESINDYVVKEDASKLTSLIEEAKQALSSSNMSQLEKKLSEIQDILKKALALTPPNFFALGYYLTFAKEPLPNLPTEKFNAVLRKYLDDHYMLDFIKDAKQALIYSADASYKEKEKVIELLKKYRSVFEKEHLDKKECLETCKLLSAEVDKSIDRMEITKDSIAYTFSAALKSEINKYFNGIENNAKEEKNFAKRQAKYQAMQAKGKETNGVPIPASIIDLDLVRTDMLRQIDRLTAHYEAKIAAKKERDYDAETIAVVDYLKANASGVVNKVTKRKAKNRAIKLMEEVGIPEARKRYNQYPFEFSGGMRQRIVIAIALAADPDILICDEPTTALDVTIQSQILELINRIKEKKQLSVIFITHDLGVVANMADRIAVMYAGKIVEYGTAADIFYESAHPYTWALLSSMPDLDTNEKLDAIPGTPPNMIYPPVGDAFAARNKYAMKIDFERQPPMFQISDSHYAATWLLHPDAPKVDRPKGITDRIARMKERGKQDA